jgi:ASCH domain
MNAGTIFVKEWRCLSVRQPWANLNVGGIKDVENRIWNTDYRGPLLIHAGLIREYPSFTQEQVSHMYQQRFDNLHGEPLQLGGIVGTVDLIGVINDSSSPWAMRGQHHWQLANAKPLPFTSLPGKQRFFTVYEWEDPDGSRVFGFDRPWDTAPRKVQGVSLEKLDER